MRVDEYIKSVEFLADHLSPVQRFYAGYFGVIPVVDQFESNWAVSATATIQNAYSFEHQAWFCLTSADDILPHGDVVLGVILLLQYDVEKYLENAYQLSGIPSVIDYVDEAAYRIIRPEETEGTFSPENCNSCETERGETGYVVRNLCDYHEGLSHGLSAGFYARAGFNEFPKSFGGSIAEEIAHTSAVSHAEIKRLSEDPDYINSIVKFLSYDDKKQEDITKVLEKSMEGIVG